MPITISNRGDFSKTIKFLRKMEIFDKLLLRKIEKYGQMGVDLLSEATPKKTGKTAASWSYEVRTSGPSVSIIWSNSNVNRGIPIVVLIQYGHGLPNGGYVEGIDFINPAMRPLFEKMAKDIWLEVNTS